MIGGRPAICTEMGIHLTPVVLWNVWDSGFGVVWVNH
jgi:hypothetical protein